VRVQH